MRQPPPAQLRAQTRFDSCPRCHGALTDVQSPAWVLATTDIHQVTICEQRCASTCCGYSSLDGSEHFVQRQCRFSSSSLGLFELCFRHDLLYDALRWVAHGGMYYRRFTMLLRQYEDMGWQDAQLNAMQSFYRHFQHAIMDFCDLMDLPFDEVLRCQCATPHQHLNPDGITVATKLSQMYVVSTHLPQQPGPDEPDVAALHGSAYAERFAVRDKALRLRLHDVSSEQGMSSLEVAALQVLCDDASCVDVSYAEKRAIGAVLGWMDASGSLQRIAERDTLTLPDWARTFVHLLGSDSPALAIVPIADVPIVRRFVSCMRGTVQVVRAAQEAADAAQAAADAVQEQQHESQRAADAAAAVAHAQVAARAQASLQGWQWGVDEWSWVSVSMPGLWHCMQHLHGAVSQPGNAELCLAMCTLFERLEQVRMPRMLCWCLA